jgi:hypothetical protein
MVTLLLLIVPMLSLATVTTALLVWEASIVVVGRSISDACATDMSGFSQTGPWTHRSMWDTLSDPVHFFRWACKKFLSGMNLCMKFDTDMSLSVATQGIFRATCFRSTHICWTHTLHTHTIFYYMWREPLSHAIIFLLGRNHKTKPEYHSYSQLLIFIHDYSYLLYSLLLLILSKRCTCAIKHSFCV